MITRLRRFGKLKSLVVAILCIPFVVYAFTSPGNPTGYVNDFASVLTLEQKSTLENKISLFNASTTNEIAVVTVKNLGGDYIENYAVKLFEAWKIGTSKNDNGVLLLIAVEDRKMRIEVGYGLEGALTDSVAAAIIRDDLTPSFKQNDFYGGIDKAVDDIIRATRGEYQSTGEGAKNSSGGMSLELIFFLVIVGIQFFSSILGRSKSWWAGGVIGGVAGGVLTAIGFLGMSLTAGIIITVILTFLGLLFDYIVSRSYSSAVASGSSIPWWAGGGRGGGGGGSSFGGFGGGRSGGGGASGGW